MGIERARCCLGHSRIKQTNLSELFLYFCGLRVKYKIDGDSMLPALKAGSFVLGKKFTSDFVSLLTGKSVIVFYDETHGRTLVKRITKVDSFEKKVFVSGDNQLLSATIEPVDFSRVLAIVTSVSSP